MQNLRNTNDADLVVMLVADSQGATGIAYTQRPNCAFDNAFGETVPGCFPGAAYNNFAFAVVSIDFATSFQVFAHETGHQLGMEHHREAFPVLPVASFPWSFGHFVNGQNETVLSFANGNFPLCPNGCPRALQYSNPDVFFINSAVPSGTVDDWNARTAAALAPGVSEFRDPQLLDLIYRNSFESLPIP